MGRPFVFSEEYPFPQETGFPLCLKLYPERDIFSEPYADLSFIEVEYQALHMSDLLEKTHHLCGGFSTSPNTDICLSDADYFLVMTGNDYRNIEIATALDTCLRREAIRSARFCHQAISAEIRDGSLGTALDHRYQRSGQNVTAFGSVKSQYCWRNVVMDDIYLFNTADDYLNPSHWPASAVEEFRKESSGEKTYQRGAGIARELHQSYKIFSAGCSGADTYEKKCEYIRRIAKEPQLRNALTWLEHRRWNAYIRSLGYEYPGDSYVGHKDSKEGSLAYKDAKLKYHTCLVECCVPVSGEERDMLWLIEEREHRQVKKYDVPDGKNAPGFSERELLRYLNRLTAEEAAALDESHIRSCWRELLRDPAYQGRAEEIMDRNKNKYGFYLADNICKELAAVSAESRLADID